MKTDPSKCKAIVLGNSHSDSKFVYYNNVSPLEEDTDLLCVTVDSKLKYETHVAKICRKVIQQVTILKKTKTSPFQSMKLCLPFIVS